MKRILVFAFALFVMCTLAAAVAYNSLANPTENIQFYGYVKTRGGTPARYGTEVRVFLGSTLKVTYYLVRDDGYYQIRGDDNNYPTGNYTLKADDLVGLLGVETNVSHTIHVSTNQDIILDTAY